MNRETFDAAGAIRPGKPEELQAVLALDPAARHDGQRCRRLRAGLDAGQVQVATIGGRPVGYLLVGEFFGHPFIELVGVEPGQRRRGVATRLVQRVLAHHTGDKVFTSTNRSNRAMRQLLEAQGFVRCGFIEHLDPGDPELVYVMLCSPGGQP